MLIDSNRVTLQCWGLGLCECEVTLCSPNRKRNNPVYESIEVNVVVLTYVNI